MIDLSEQFLGVYENGILVHSFPIASGERDNKTPTGEFRITAFPEITGHLSIQSGTGTPYPMNYGLRFFINREGSRTGSGRDIRRAGLPLTDASAL